MASIPLLGGMIANNQAEFVESVPLNLEPVAIDNKISTGQFRAPAGLEPYTTGPGEDRGAINWGGRHFRVMGTKLVEIGVGVLGDVGGSGPVAMDYGFDRLAIASDQKLFYLTTTLNQVTDIDLGGVNDALWVDGYYMTTDGSYIVVTELSDPTKVEPLKYGSAEEDPDMITGLIKVRGEVYATGRHTIEVLQNVGGNGFPFAVVDGATIPYGCVSPSAKCPFAESFAFVGSARNEALGVYVAGSGTAIKISNRALDRALAAIPDPTVIELECWTFLDEKRLLVHLPDGETWVYCDGTSRQVSQRIWYRRTGCPRHAIEKNGDWFAAVGDEVGTLSNSISTILGDPVEWQFDTPFAHADGSAYILGSIELVGLPGRMPHGEEATAYFSYSVDGETRSRELMIRLGKAGERRRRMVWRPRCRIPHYATFRFRGYDAGMPGFTKIEADVEPLS